MGRLGITVIGTMAIAAVVATAFALRPHRDVPSLAAAEPIIAKSETPSKTGAMPALYCEFTNVADRTPLVGFSFTIEENRPNPVYALIFQREQDGTQDDFGGASASRSEWSYDDSQSPPVIHSLDDAMQINFYDDDPKMPGSNWFEAGLRSVRYRNLGGKCRHSAA